MTTTNITSKSIISAVAGDNSLWCLQSSTLKRCSVSKLAAYSKTFSNWTTVDPARYSARAPSGNRITCSNTAGMTAGIPIRIGQGPTYGIIHTESTNSYIDYLGKPVSVDADLSSLAVGIPEQIVVVPYADLLVPWRLPKAHLIGVAGLYANVNRTNTSTYELVEYYDSFGGYHLYYRPCDPGGAATTITVHWGASVTVSINGTLMWSADVTYGVSAIQSTHAPGGGLFFTYGETPVITWTADNVIPATPTIPASGGTPLNTWVAAYSGYPYVWVSTENVFTYGGSYCYLVLE